MPKAQETILEINLKALKHNFDYLKSKLEPSTKFLAVVKAFAYGSDANQVALHLQKLGVDCFAVAYVNEGVSLRNAGISLPIIVLHPQPNNFKLLIDNCLEPSLYNAKVLNDFIDIAQSNNQNHYPVHIKFNTGLNRLGFWDNDVDYVAKKIAKSECIKVSSIFSHLAASEDQNEKQFSLDQVSNFKEISIKFNDALGYAPKIHICNTSGLINYPEAHFDMVRVGIGLYGFTNSKTEDKFLKPVATLKSVISQIHMIEPNESVGYNRSFISSGYSKSATIPIGHADGIGRQYGNGNGVVSINNKIAPIIGNVCMDMLMVDVTDIDCKEGDEVILFGQEITANDLALKGKTISYELLTAISQRVKRKIID